MNTTVRLPRIVRFPVEAGHIQLFARAIGDPNPIYSDENYARRTTLGGIIAPPTFSEAGNHFDEDWPYRPRWNFESGPVAPTTDVAGDDERGTDMHAETHFVYHQPVRPGMVLSVRARPGREWKKWGARSGALMFHEVVAEFRDVDGAHILDCTTVVLRTERKVANSAPSRREPISDEAAVDAPGAWREKFPVGPNLKTGDRIREVLVRNLSRAQIVQYAGVSCDFSAQHVDEVYNTQVAGYPSVFAPGMLTMGMAGRVVTDFIGDGRLRKFGFQFRQQVWPGDSLFADLEVTGVATQDASSADLSISVTNQHGQLIGGGYANAII